MKSNSITIILLALLLSYGASVPTTHAQVLEETVTLESIYESRARAVLNSFLRPHEYSLVVSAELDRDERRLKKYREDVEMRFLPGMPMPGSPEMIPENNTLHELKSNIKVHLVLNEDVSPEKEEVLKTILSSKLKLDLEGGDSLSISRTRLPASDRQPELVAEFTWKTWLMIILLSLLALAGFVMYASRRKLRIEEDRTMEGSPLHAAMKPIDMGALEASLASPEAQSSDQESDEEQTPSREEIERSLKRNIADHEELILTLGSQYPQICSRALMEHISLGHTDEAVIVGETIGWETSKKVFSHVTPRVWGEMGHALRDRLTEPSLEQKSEAFTNSYRAMLARVLEFGADGDKENPFAFIFRLSAAEKSELFEQEGNSALAIIALFSSESQMTEILDSLTTDRQGEVMLELSRFEKLPETAVKAAANSLLERYKSMKANATVHAEGPKVLANLLKTLAPEKEMDLFAQLQEHSPEEAEKVSRERVQFLDLDKYPEDVMRSSLEPMDVGILTVCLINTQAEFAKKFTEYLPTKKANMVLGDLNSGAIKPAKAEIGQARREITEAVEAKLKERGLSTEEVWNSMDEGGSDSHLRAI